MTLQPLRAYIYPAYGLASLGKVAVEVTLQLYLFDFYTRLLGLSPILAGTAFAIAILWDALSDVVVAAGLLGARRRGILYSTVLWWGSLLLAGTAILLYSPPVEGSQAHLFFHLLVAYVLVNTGMTLLDLPQSSLSAELSRKAGERNKLLASRLGFGIVGLSLGSVLPGLLLASGADADNTALSAARTESAWILAAVVVFTGSLTAAFTRKREASAVADEHHEIPRLKDVFELRHDTAFIRITIAGVISAVARTVNAALALMYYRFVLELSEAEVTRFIFPIFTLSIVLSVPLWVLLAKRFGKKAPAASAVAGLGIMGIIAYPILPESLLWPPLVVSTIGGIFCGAVFLVDSMITDLIDADEARTGKRREALYFAVWKSVLKIARALAFVIIGFGLEIGGLDLSLGEVSRTTEWVIVGLFGFFVGICFVVAGWFIQRAPVPAPLEK